MKEKLRVCTYRGEKHYFHRWFDEGGQLDNGGTIDIGAILEDEEGNIQKTFAIADIKFDVTYGR